MKITTAIETENEYADINDNLRNSVDMTFSSDGLNNLNFVEIYFSHDLKGNEVFTISLQELQAMISPFIMMNDLSNGQ